ncbi:aldehyde dehydrogenase [Nitrogeniibacter mangrovi]|uniref:Aldehyde dehydrogenase n=1 Tax=Nitrogeniibacter mangrovi TaxID=2016596 RepID=A0A6C1B7B6_9RHOO|nr:aldehyde dehydrogenase [Nitrogeniibacter mangrovi]QID19253.1 aldehyde dehydrogenase [Nitrogeniibacter mangrovi]
MTRILENFIDGRFVSGSALEHRDVRNPANGALLAQMPLSTAAGVEEALAAARRAQPAWEALPAIQRAGYLRRIAGLIRDNAGPLAETITREQGKVLALAQVEVAFTADYMDYMAEWARRIEGEVIPSDRVGESIFLMRRAIGVTAGILPWNFPFFLIARKMAPALVTGNTIVVKPSEETPINAFDFARLVQQAELPAGVFNLVGGDGATAGASLAASRQVNLVSFTGSVATGKRIMAAAAPNLTRVNLELGGKAPAIVTANADLDLAAKAICDSRVINTGQVCNCAERVYVARAVATEFTEKVAARMAEVRYGDPIADPSVHMGPLVNRQGLDKVAGMVERARAEGAEVLMGGSVAPTEQGFHYLPTVLFDCRHDMEVMRAEIFGPVLPIQVVDGLDEAIALSNDSDYGLTSSIFSRDLAEVMQACNGLKFGETYVNREHFEAMQGFHAGRRHSGIGGADGKHGLLEYTETQVVYMQHG